VTGRPSRTWIAAILTAAGILAPSTAWFVAGSRAVREEAARIEAEPAEHARLEAAHLAQQIGLRLESLRESEERRPFQDYLTDGSTWIPDCVAPASRPSSLAGGPRDPLVWAHFQIDDVGLLTLPAFDADDALASAGRAVEIQQAIYNELECASSYHLAALHRGAATGPGAGARGPSPHGVVTVGAFTWHTSSIEGAPALVALREVATPAAVLTQGFVVPSTHLASLLEGSILPASLHPGEPPSAAAARLPLQGDAWSVTVDAGAAAAAAGADARRVVSRFHVRFLGGSAAALLAGAAIVLLVRQTERMARDRARFAAAAAHELRTPLAGLRLYGEMLADEATGDGRSEAYARRIAAEAERLGRVVSNVLGFARLERGGLGLVARPGDLGAVVRGAVERLRPAVEADGATVSVDTTAAVPQAEFDAAGVEQILQNLVDNAAKHSRPSSDRRIDVSVGSEDGAPSVTVRDRGPGVDPARERWLFRPFPPRPERDEPSGLGIGLALASALAEAQGASLRHVRPPDGGAAFVLRLRRA
jgi:signal transduction histidine kinase